jgi:diaminopimelate decarboxylase
VPQASLWDNTTYALRNTKSMKEKYERPIIKKMNAGLMDKFGMHHDSAPVTTIDGVTVKGLIKEFGSPLFVLSEKQIRRNYQSAVRSFSTRYPNVQFAWSYKTNYINAVCKIFHQEGSWAEVVSGFEYRKAINNGVLGNQIIFNGPDKKFDDLVLAITNQSLIHIDHFDELELIISICDQLNIKAKVAIRVNMDTGVYPIWDRFGFNYENGQAWTAISKAAKEKNLELVGLHCHIGTFMLATSPYVIATKKLCDLAMRCNLELQNPIQYIDLGGGFPSKNPLKGSLPATDDIPLIEEFADAITDTILQFGFKTDELPLLILESGRALIDDAGYLLGSVIANKRLSDGRRATIVDFGINLLFTSNWYDHKVSPAQECSQYSEDTVLFGPLCMNIDIVRYSIDLPLLDPGDQLVVHKVGAYNMTQWMQFINMRPAVVLIDMKGQIHRIRKAETLAYLEEVEELPVYLK